MLADSNSATAAARKTRGIALNGAALNQPLAVHKGATSPWAPRLTPGTAYYQSRTRQAASALVADVGAGEYVRLLGIA